MNVDVSPVCQPGHNLGPTFLRVPGGAAVGGRDARQTVGPVQGAGGQGGAGVGRGGGSAGRGDGRGGGG